jgi:methylamine dehydrogenase accessory protein MauD
MGQLWMISYALLWALVLILLLGIAALAREIGLLHRRLPPVGARGSADGPAVGKHAPSFEEVSVTGEPVTLAGSVGKATLIVFVSPSCSACNDLAPSLRTIARTERDHLMTVVISSGDLPAAKEFGHKYRLGGVALVASEELGVAWGVNITPYAFAIDATGMVIAKGLVNHIEHLDSLVDTLRFDHADPPREEVSELRRTNLRVTIGRRK